MVYLPARVDFEKLSSDRMWEISESIRKRVQVARICTRRYACERSGNFANYRIRVGSVHLADEMYPSRLSEIDE